MRLPAELRNKICQYTLSGYAIQPYDYHPKPRKLMGITYCEPAPGTTVIRPEEGLWLLVQSLSHSSRQLHAEIGEMLFTESVICCNVVYYFCAWLGYLSERPKSTIENIQWAPEFRVYPGCIVDRFFEVVDDLLPNIKTLYVRESIYKSEPWVEEKIAQEAQKRGLKVSFERSVSRLDE